MSKSSGIVKSVETWTVRNPDKSGPIKTDFKTVVKVAVRLPNGQFHGATNFRQKG